MYVFKEGQHEQTRIFLCESFNEETLTEILRYFDQLAKASSSDNSHEDDKTLRNNCHRVRTVLLQCAGTLPRDSMNALAAQFNTSTLLCDEDDNKNMSSHVALLCLWGQTDKAICSLCDSIRNGWSKANIFDDDEEEQHHLPVSSKFKPTPPTVALSTLEVILKSEESSSTAARDRILSSSVAQRALMETLKAARSAAERLLCVEEV